VLGVAARRNRLMTPLSADRRGAVSCQTRFFTRRRHMTGSRGGASRTVPLLQPAVVADEEASWITRRRNSRRGELGTAERGWNGVSGTDRRAAAAQRDFAGRNRGAPAGRTKVQAQLERRNLLHQITRATRAPGAQHHLPGGCSLFLEDQLAGRFRPLCSSMTGPTIR